MRSRRWRSAFGMQRLPALRHRLAEADRGEHVLQAPARAHVHVHVAGGDQRQARFAGESSCSALKLRAIVRPAMQLGGDPGLRRESARRATPPGRNPLRAPRAPARRCRQAPRRRPAERIAPFLAAPPAGGDERRRSRRTSAGRWRAAPACPPPARISVPRISWQAALLRRLVRAHHAGERAFVGQRERAVAERRGALHQLLADARRRAGS